MRPGLYVRLWGGFALRCRVVMRRGEAWFVPPSGFAAPVTQVPDAVWVPETPGGSM